MSTGIWSALTGLFLVLASSAYGTPLPIPPRSQILSKIAFGSCLDQDRPQPIWDVVAEFKPDLFLLLGDNVYAKTDNMAELARRYDTQAKHPEFARARTLFPFLSVWDDNDYGLPDSGSEFPHKEQSKELFLRFFHAPKDDQRRAHPGVYGSWTFGPEGKAVQIILLDTRTFRGPLLRKSLLELPGLRGPYTPHGKTSPIPVLGEEQWSWLQEMLHAPVQLRIVGSSIQVVSDEHGFESWGNFPHERARLVQLLTSGASVPPTIILSGDRHHGELSVALDLGTRPIVEFTSSSLNLPRPRVEEANRYRVAGPIFEANFGAIEIRWEDRPRTLLSLRSAAGDLAFTHEVERPIRNTMRSEG